MVLVKNISIIKLILSFEYTEEKKKQQKDIIISKQKALT